MKIKLTEKKTVLIILSLTLVALALPFVLRFFNGNITLMGDDAYHHLKLAENQDLLFQARFFTPYDLMLFVFNLIIPSTAWSALLSILLGLGSVLLFNNFLKKFKLTLEEKFFILIFLVLSPAFIYFFTFSNQRALVVFLLLLAINLLETKNNSKWLALPLILSIAFFDGLTTIIILGFLLVYWLLKKDKAVLYSMASLFLLALLLQAFYPRPWTYEPFLGGNFFTTFFSDLGSLNGVSLFALLTAAIGLSVTWKKRKVFYFTYPAMIFLILLLAFINNYEIFYFNFILAFFAGQGMMWLWQRKWQMNFLKTLSVTLLLLGVVLSTASYLNAASQVPPNNFVEESLRWLKENSRSGEIVISHSSKSFWIEAWAERPVFLDVYSVDYQDRVKASQVIFNSRDLELTTRLLEENKISYIWIDAEMHRGQVWKDGDEGLLFLFRNPRFRNIYNKHGIEIWRFG